MKKNLFNRLPEELTERIIAKLPISSVFDCRCVCKQWYKLLKSNSFLELWNQISPRDLWFLVYHTCRIVAAYSPTSGNWNNLPLYDRCSLDSSQVLLLASSGGLLCFRNRNSDYPTLIVCNPVTSSYRILPDMPQVRYIDIVGMIAMSSSTAADSYKILVTGTSEPASNESITEVYDSRTGIWEQQCCSDQEFLQFWYEVHAIWHDGFFYCLATPLNTSQGYRLIAYDMEKRVWVDLNVKMPFGDIRCPSLLICQGKLYLAGKIVEDYLIRSICIWKLNLEKLRWVKVVEMPDEVLKKIHSPHSVLIQCQGHGDLMCFSTHRGWQSIIYNFVERSWHWLPENEICVRSKSQAMGRNNLVGLLYEPSLSARV
ncbi:F-box/kelch-repeat protein [Thalictrum thalictroides]|uniref:F-box/kelch-repeat protein n=1 Tax=Thalictrum thalictroides TaxID=46969 RepID=A0A7J6WHY5_THATH|nr:F-box/kelch-repeat protein [Thalictrum thalictroides]